VATTCGVIVAACQREGAHRRCGSSGPARLDDGTGGPASAAFAGARGQGRKRAPGGP
jgi:hypothetical protein